MGAKIDYVVFLEKFDKKLDEYFKSQAVFVCCKKGCSACCEKGDYPLSETELKYLMLGYSKLPNELKVLVQKNVKSIKKGESCPFLINKECAVYNYRPIICRVHGLAYLSNNIAKLPYCVNEGKNYSKVYKDGELLAEPIKENLDTVEVLKEFDFGEIRNLCDWLSGS